MANTTPFSMSTMFDALPHDLRFPPARQFMNAKPRVIRPPPPPPPFSRSAAADSLFCWDWEITEGLTPEIVEIGTFQWIFNLMTRSDDDVPHFKDVISVFDIRERERMVYMLTSDSDFFMDIARDINGSKNIQRLMGKSEYMDAVFCEAITRLFLQVMTNKFASYVGIQGTRVFQQDKKEPLYELILQYGLYLARDQHGCIALNQVITDLDHSSYRNQLLDLVAINAVWLSNDHYGNFVIQHLLRLKDMRCTRNIAVNLRGHYVDLSFKKFGSYIVEGLLKVGDSVMEEVVMDLVKCEGERLMRLARSEYGNFVVRKALGLTKKNYMTADLFNGLVKKLIPFRHLLPRSPGRNIATILDSVLISS
ncbi:PREDICTED: putative pumilio homolog 16 [Camelina sativa]|uniref:Pumilio homolog 16 n=1 Tax=Camelina sativa TaxID=90675 RepID=A0ABM0XFI1_CAMSA|nr:PREDICTED: putative pumilio homolog 16 [Camelina sativa]